MKYDPPKWEFTEPEPQGYYEGVCDDEGFLMDMIDELLPIMSFAIIIYIAAWFGA
jgi:hypothetical protein